MAHLASDLGCSPAFGQPLWGTPWTSDWTQASMSNRLSVQETQFIFKEFLSQVMC